MLYTVGQTDAPGKCVDMLLQMSMMLGCKMNVFISECIYGVRVSAVPLLLLFFFYHATLNETKRQSAFASLKLLGLGIVTNPREHSGDRVGRHTAILQHLPHLGKVTSTRRLCHQRLNVARHLNRHARIDTASLTNQKRIGRRALLRRVRVDADGLLRRTTIDGCLRLLLLRLLLILLLMNVRASGSARRRHAAQIGDAKAAEKQLLNGCHYAADGHVERVADAVGAAECPREGSVELRAGDDPCFYEQGEYCIV